MSRRRRRRTSLFSSPLFLLTLALEAILLLPIRLHRHLLRLLPIHILRHHHPTFLLIYPPPPIDFAPSAFFAIFHCKKQCFLLFGTTKPCKNNVF